MRIQQPPTTGDPAPPSPGGSLNEIGRVKVGQKTTARNGKEIPCSTDHFVVTTEYLAEFQQLYGEAPTRLPITFISSDTDHSCDERLELRDPSGKLVAHGDGINFEVYNDERKKYVFCTLNQRPDLMEGCVEYLKKKHPESQHKYLVWKPVLRLRFLLRDFPVLGYFQFTTHAEKTTIPAIRNVFDECLRVFSTVQFLPFVLAVKMVKSNTPGVATQYPIVSLIPEFSLNAGLALRNSLAGALPHDPIRNLLDLPTPAEVDELPHAPLALPESPLEAAVSQPNS